MNQNLMESILDNLSATAVYLINLENYKLLYYNQKAAEAEPQMHQGTICTHIWQRFAVDGLLADLEAKDSYSVVKHDELSGEIVEMAVTKMTCDDGVLAALISVTPHVLTDFEKQQKVRKQSLKAAVERVYNLTISINLTKDTFDVITCSKNYGEEFPEDGVYSHLVDFAVKQMHPDYHQKFSEAFSRDAVANAFEKGQNEIYMEHRQKEDDGSWGWTNSRIMKMGIKEDGQLMAVLMTASIGERRKIEREREVFNSGITVLFGECVILDVETGTFTVAKYDRSMEKLVVGNDYRTLHANYGRELIHPDELDTFLRTFSLDAIRKSVSKGQDTIMAEFRRKDADGVYHWVEMIGIKSGRRRQDESSVILTYRDIDAIYLAQKGQKEANLRFSNAISDLYSLILEADLYSKEMQQWKLTDQGIECFEMGETLDEYFIRILEEKIHPDYLKDYASICDREEVLRQFESGVKEIYREAPRKMEDGTYRWHSAHAQILLKDEGQLRVMYYIKDIDDSKKEEEQKRAALVDALSLAEQANNAKTNFLSNMSHDIRTPMNAIIGMVAIAKTTIENQQKTAECLSKIENSANYLLSLINDVLDMSKIESGKMVLVPENFYLDEFINTVVDNVSAEMGKKKQTLELEIEDSVNTSYEGDVLRLKQILINLLNNAVKYTGDGGDIVFRIKPAKRNAETAVVRFEIEDNGMGMDEEQLKRIYEPFVQGDSKRNGELEGSGLGLSIARNLVHLMGGYIHVSSEKGVGSCFAVEIPLKPALECELEQLKKKEGNQVSEEVKALVKGSRLLIVEDNELNLEIVKSLFEMESFVVEAAENGQEALDMFSASEPGYYRLILMDIQMPVMDGLESTAAIRKIDRGDAKKIPIIALSANAFSEDIGASLEAGMNAHLSKPLDIQAAIALVQRCLWQRLREEERKSV